MAEAPVGHREDISGDQFETTNRPSHARDCSVEGSCASSSFEVRRHKVGVGASFQVRICVDVRFDRGGRKETPPSAWRRCAVKRCKSIGARSGHKGVRLGEATNPGPLKLLHRFLARQSYPERAERQLFEMHGTVFGRSGLERRLIRVLEQASSNPAINTAKIDGQ